MKSRAVLWDDVNDTLIFAGPLTEGDPEEELEKTLAESKKDYLLDDFPVLIQNENEI